MQAKNAIITETITYSKVWEDCIIRKVNQFTGKIVWVGTRGEWKKKNEKKNE